MAKIVKIGVLGYGFVQDTFHLPCYSEIPDVRVVALGGRNKEKAALVARKFGVKKTYHGEDFLSKLCSDPEVDVVDIGLPNFLHREASEVAAEEGKHVICEKPLARSVEEAKAALSAAERHGVIDCYAENQVFSPHVTRAKDIVIRGSIGKVFWIRSREAHFGPHSAWFWKPELAGGGVLMDMGCHSVEVARYLIGKKPVKTFAWAETLVHSVNAEDNSLASVSYEGGEIGQSENSWAAHGGLDLRFEIYGSEGAIFIDATRETGLRVFTVAPEEKVSYVVEKAEAKKGWMYPVWREHEIYGYLAELQHFTACIREGEKPRETYRDGYMVNCILDACYRSVRSGRWEPIEL